MRTEVRLSGFGGQGIVLSGYILGKAASIYDDKNATMTQSYGPEARGGACTSNVVIADEAIDFPGVTSPDVLVLMSQEAYHTHKAGAREDTRLFCDADLVKVDEGQTGVVTSVPAMRVAQEELGRKIVANIVMLGFVSSFGVLGPDAVKQAVLTSVPAHTKELNEKAFARGYEEGLKAQGKGGG